jgi:hypothetical protein
MYTVQSSEFESSTASHDLRRFDFWFLCTAQIAALSGIYISIFGFNFGQRRLVFHYLFLSLIYASSTAAIAAILPRKVGLPVLPLFEDLRSGALSMRAGAWPLIVGAAAGIIISYSVNFYDNIVTTWLGSGGAANNVFVPNALGLVCAIISEEILFRAIIFSVLAVAVEFIWCRLTSHGKLVPLAIANVLQALLFGAEHIAAGRGVLNKRPWYIRLPLVSQTWGGVILGLVYWKYGVESAIVCHATTDLFLLIEWRIK